MTQTIQYNITGGIRPGGEAGTNLFHSFGDFNVPTHNIANFFNDSGLATSNILGRVTGGNPSTIFGTIQTTGFGNANLYLMNPAGIVFGPTASLNVGGSVTFTTADYLRFTDNGSFNAVPSGAADKLLSTEPVAAYGFLGSNPGAITVQGSQLAVPGGQGISLIGGNITISNGTLENGDLQLTKLSAPYGQINLATAKSPGEFLQDLTVTPNINGASFRSFGSAHFASGSTVDVSQTGNGKVSIRGGQLVLEIQNAFLDTADRAASTVNTPEQDVIVLTAGSSIISQTSSADQGPHIQIVADRIQLGSALPPFEATQGIPVNIWARTDGRGDAGNITLRTTGDLGITNMVAVESTSGFNWDGTRGSLMRATGNAGNVELISTHGNIRMTGGDAAPAVTSQTLNSSGNTGTITASAAGGDIVLNNSSLFTATRGTGAAGQTQITAKNLKLINSAISDDNFGPLKPGGISIALSDNLTLTDSSVIATASVSPTGAAAADLNITAKDIIVTQGSFLTSATHASGPGGQLKINADTLQLTKGGQIISSSTEAPFGDAPPLPTGPGGNITIAATAGPTGSLLIDGTESGIFTNTVGKGQGGNLNLTAHSLTIQNGGVITASTLGTTQIATGGNIAISAEQFVTLNASASITASSTGPANAGNISINAGQQLDVRDSSITTNASQASGGNIDIRATDHVRFANSQISASVGADKGNGGNITIDPNVVVLQNSQIRAQAVEGRGGGITITTPLFLSDPPSIVDASSLFGLHGFVVIRTPTSNLSGTVKQLATNPSEAQALLQNRCVALAGGAQSTFIVAGRDALPSEPGGWLSSPFSMNHLPGHDAEHATGPAAKSIGPPGSPATVLPVRETQALSIRRLTPPGFLVRSFGIDGLTNCRS